jgi:serine phosphatase RsbU (regulator of sigma subunit)
VELALVPEIMSGSFGEIGWAGHFEAVGEAGSDFFGVYSLTDGRVVMLIGDAIGKGLAGSMVSAVVKSCCDAIFDTNPSRLDPATLLRALNRALYRSRNPVHTSAFVLVFDPNSLHLEYANAGNPFPYHLAGGPAVTVLGVLSGSGPLLGDEVDARYRTQHMSINAGDSLVLFTDGLVRARNGDGETFGERGLQRLLKRFGPGTPEGLRDDILKAVAEYRKNTPFPDDVAMIVIGSR